MNASEDRPSAERARVEPRIAIPSRLDRALLRLRTSFHRRLAEELGLSIRPGDPAELLGRSDREAFRDLERRASEEERERYLASLPWWRRWQAFAERREEFRS